MTTFGKNAKAEMNRQKLSQRALAESIGISQPSIANILNGKTKNPKYAFLIAKRLGRTVEELMGDDDALLGTYDDNRTEVIRPLVESLNDKNFKKLRGFLETLTESQIAQTVRN